jgi:hypothetical protein
MKGLMAQLQTLRERESVGLLISSDERYAVSISFPPATVRAQFSAARPRKLCLIQSIAERRFVAPLGLQVSSCGRRFFHAIRVKSARRVKCPQWRYREEVFLVFRVIASLIMVQDSKGNWWGADEDVSRHRRSASIDSGKTFWRLILLQCKRTRPKVLPSYSSSPSRSSVGVRVPKRPSF